MRTSTLSLSLFACLAAAPAQAQYLLVANNTNNTIDLHSDFDGSLITAAYIDTVPQTGSNPNDCLVVGNEIWVIDQDDDQMYRYSLDGTTYLGSHGVGILNNCRGGGIVGNEVWVTNASGVPGQAVVRFDLAGAHLGNFPQTNPFDVIPYQGDALVIDMGNDDIQRYSAAGAFLSTFHNSDGVTGIDTPEFGTVRANGNVLVGGLTSPTGIYEYDPTGAQLNYYNTGTLLTRCAVELGNGLIFFTTSAGKHTYNPVGGAIVMIGPGDTKSITRFAGPSTGTPYCFGDGTGTFCPCSPVPVPHGAAGKGCPTNAFPGGSKTSGLGNASIANDTLVLTATDMINGSMIFYQGPTQQSGGAGQVFGDGLRCIQPTSIRRFKTKPVALNTVSYPGVGDPLISVAGLVTAPGVRHYQGWYRSANPTFCTVDTFNLTNGLSVTWGP